MKFRFGPYTHDANDVQVVKIDHRKFYSARHRSKLRSITLVIRGRVKIDSTSMTPAADQMRTLVQNLENNYYLDDTTCGLYHDDGTPTAHVLTSSFSLDGIRVIQFGWDAPTGGAEYSVVRSFYAVLQATYAALTESLITDFRETLRTIGDGGPETTLDSNGNVVIIQPRTPVVIIQEGYVVGLNGWPEVWVPQPRFPLYENHLERLIERTGGESHRFGFLDRRISWRFIHNLPAWSLQYPGEL